MAPNYLSPVPAAIPVPVPAAIPVPRPASPSAQGVGRYAAEDGQANALSWLSTGAPVRRLARVDIV
jgi:hypothetical protein